MHRSAWGVPPYFYPLITRAYHVRHIVIFTCQRCQRHSNVVVCFHGIVQVGKWCDAVGIITRRQTLGRRNLSKSGRGDSSLRFLLPRSLLSSPFPLSSSFSSRPPSRPPPPSSFTLAAVETTRVVAVSHRFRAAAERSSTPVLFRSDVFPETTTSSTVRARYSSAEAKSSCISTPCSWMEVMFGWVGDGGGAVGMSWGDLVPGDSGFAGSGDGIVVMLM